MFAEYDTVSESKRNEFVLYKTLTSIFYIAYLVILIKRPDLKYKNLLYVVIGLFYSVTSSLFRPLYVIAIFDIMIVFIFLFPMTKKEFWTFSTLGMWVYTLALAFRFPNVAESQLSPSLSDHILIGLQRHLILIVTFYFFIKARDYQLQAEKRFGLLGRQAARVAHDIKGMLSAPILILDGLKSQNRVESRDKTQDSINLISEQIEQIHGSLLELSRLCSLDQLPMSRFSLNDSLQGVRGLYLKNLEEVDFFVSGDINFYCDRSLVTSIFSNLIGNTLNQFKKKLWKTRCIEIKVEKNAQDTISLTYLDTGGGFSTNAIQAINQLQPYSTEGSGIGLQLVRECVGKLNGSVVFDNFGNGARAVMLFKKSDFIK